MSLKRHRLLTRVTPPASEPLTLAQAKLYLRVDHTNDDTAITDLITAARMQAEEYLKRSLITQSWKLAFDDYLPEYTPLPMGPVNSITSVVAFNRDGSSQTITSSAYYLNAAKNKLVLDSVIFSFRVEVTYSTGYGTAAEVPEPIVQGMLSHIAAMYDQRGSDLGIPESARALYEPYREVRL